MALDKLSFKVSDIKKISVVGGRQAKTAQSIVDSLAEKPDYIINGAHFDNNLKSKTYGLTISDTIVNRTLINGGNNGGIYQAEGLGWSAAADIAYMTTAQAVKDKKMYFLGGSPSLLINGKINSSWLKTAFAKSSTQRIGMGIKKNEIVFIFPKEKCNLIKVADLLKAEGCTDAIALDGGGSQYVGEVKDGKVIHLDNNKCNRPVSTWILIYLNKPKAQEPKKTTFPKVYEVTAEKLNMRSDACITAPLYKKSIPTGYLKKGNRITVFEIKYNAQEKRYWARSYGYWVALNYLKEV